MAACRRVELGHDEEEEELLEEEETASNFIRVGLLEPNPRCPP